MWLASPPLELDLKRFLKPVFWVGVLGLVGWFVARAFTGARESFQENEFTVGELDWAILGWAGGAYLVGLLPCWWYWRHTLRSMGQSPPFLGSLAAYFIGHLGKYVPGKAMVVVLRAGFIRGPRVDTSAAASSVFVETLTMMAVGAFLAAMILLFIFPEPLYIMLAIGFAAAASIPTCPPLFRRLMRLVRADRKGSDGRWFSDGVTFRLIGVGWVVMVPTWIFLGLSMLLTMKAIGPERIPAGVTLQDLPYLTATVSLAMVVGFLSLVPGGLGVRDAIVLGLVQAHPRFGGDVAIISTVVLRVAWLVSELGVSGILYLCDLQRRPLSSTGHTTHGSDGGYSRS